MAVLFSLCSDDWMFIGRHNAYVFPERGYPYYTRQNVLASEKGDSMATSRIMGGTVSGLLPFEQSMVLCLIGFIALAQRATVFLCHVMQHWCPALCAQSFQVISLSGQLFFRTGARYTEAPSALH